MDGDLEKLFGIDEPFEESSQIKALMKGVQVRKNDPSGKEDSNWDTIKEMHPDVKGDIEKLIAHLKSNYGEYIKKIHTIEGIEKRPDKDMLSEMWHTRSESGESKVYMEFFTTVFTRKSDNKAAVAAFSKIHSLLNKNLSEVHDIDKSIKVIEHTYGNGKNQLSNIGYGIKVLLRESNINESVETEVEGVSAIKEDGQAVGAMLPVTAPDEVYEKNILTTEAVDSEYDSLKLKKEEKEKATNQQLDSSKPESKPDATPKNEASPLAKEYKENAEEIEQLIKECGMKPSYEPVFEEGNSVVIFESVDQLFTEGLDPVVVVDTDGMTEEYAIKGLEYYAKELRKKYESSGLKKLFESSDSLKGAFISEVKSYRKKNTDGKPRVIYVSPIAKAEDSSDDSKEGMKKAAAICRKVLEEAKKKGSIKYKVMNSSIKIDEDDSNGNPELSLSVTLRGMAKASAYRESGDEAFTEGGDRHIDDDIKPMIDKLNEKGYKTMASCSGHPSSRSKSDRYRDGIKYGKLYSTARVVFDKIYDFPNVPDGWSKKVMKDDKRVGIYVDPPSFKIINGLPEKQYTNWKRRYMSALEKWVNDLPKEGETKEDDNSDVALESVLNDLTTDALVGQGYGESYTD
jgi:hypothetical protein